MIAMDRSDVVDFPLKGPLLGKNMFFQFNQLTLNEGSLSIL